MMTECEIVGSLLYMCAVCQKEFFTKASRDKHEEIHMQMTGKPFLCPQCGLGFNDKSNCDRHIVTHKGKGVYHYKCSCEMVFGTTVESTAHKEENPHHKGFVVCCKCGDRFSSEEILEIHMAVHRGEKPYKCSKSKCHKSYITFNALAVHERIHNREKRKCTRCGKELHTKYGFKKHMARFHSKVKFIDAGVKCTVMGVKSSDAKVKRTNTWVKCTDTGVECTDTRLKCTDTRVKSTDTEVKSTDAGVKGIDKRLMCTNTGVKSTNTGENPYTCIYCDETFPTSYILITHIEGHYKERTCRHCGQNFHRWTTLKSHMQKAHFVPKTKVTTAIMEADDTCAQIDDKRILVVQNLRKHKRIHQKWTHKCCECGKTFNYVEPLKIHMRTHTGERPFKCSFCDKTFITADGMSAHQEIHCEERNCTECGTVFSTWIKLKNHLDMHTGKTAEEHLNPLVEASYICGQCNKKFLTAEYLEKHITAHRQCTQCGETFSPPVDKEDTECNPVICLPCVNAFSQMFGIDI